VLNFGFKAQEFDLKKQEIGMRQADFDAERNAPIAPNYKLVDFPVTVNGVTGTMKADYDSNTGMVRRLDGKVFPSVEDAASGKNPIGQGGDVLIDLPEFNSTGVESGPGLLPELNGASTPTADAQLAAKAVQTGLDIAPATAIPGFTPAEGAEKQGVIMTPAQLQEQIASGMKVNWVAADGGNYLVTGGTAGGGPLVTVGGSQPAPPADYRNVYDEVTGNLIRQEPIPGGPADVAQRAAEEQAIPEKEARARNMFTTAANILRDVGNAIPLIEETTPFLRNEVDKESIVGRFSPGTKTFDAVQLINSVKSSIAVSELINLRSTGTTLGQVPQRQLEMLSTLLGSLTPGQSNKRLISTIDDIYKNYGEILDQYIKRNPEDEMAEFVTIRREIDQFRKKIKNEKGETKTTVESEFQKRLDAIKARQ
jgi:hypothetical protein